MATRHRLEPRWLDEREQRAWRALQFMHLRLDGALARQLAEDSNLSYPDYMVLSALTDRADTRMRLFELAETLGWEKSRVSHQVRRMAERGLVAKEACEADRRGAFVVLTRRGRDEIEAAAPGHVDAVRRLFIDRLRPDELDTIAGIGERIQTGIDDAAAPAK